MMEKTRAELIPNYRLIEVHGHANFGNSSPRDVVDETVIAFAANYTTGGTATQIAMEHGLAKFPGSNPHRNPILTPLGKKYLVAILRERKFISYYGEFPEVLRKEVKALRSENEKLRKAIAPFAHLELPAKPQGNAGAYSILFADIKAAKEVV